LRHFIEAFLGTIVLLLTLSICRAAPKWGNAAVFESYAEIIKCQEILSCAGSAINGTSRDLAKCLICSTERRERPPAILHQM